MEAEPGSVILNPPTVIQGDDGRTMAITVGDRRFEGEWSDDPVCSTLGWRFHIFDLPGRLFFHRAQWHGKDTQSLLSLHTELADPKSSCCGGIRFEPWRKSPFLLEVRLGKGYRWRYKTGEELLRRAPRQIPFSLLVA